MADREKVIKGLEELEGFLFKEYTNIKAEESKIYYDRFKSLSNAIELLKEQSQIVRCKDCKHRDPEDKKCDCGHGIRWQLPREDDWFCADGKRKET